MDEKRPDRDVTKHVRRRTAADDFAVGRLNVANIDPNYHYQIENDENGKIERLKALGYEVVTHDEGVTMGDANAKEVGDAVCTTVNKEGTKAYLLKAPIEYRHEDEKFRQDKIKEQDDR